MFKYVKEAGNRQEQSWVNLFRCIYFFLNRLSCPVIETHGRYRGLAACLIERINLNGLIHYHVVLFDESDLACLLCGPLIHLPVFTRPLALSPVHEESAQVSERGDKRLEVRVPPPLALVSTGRILVLHDD